MAIQDVLSQLKRIGSDAAPGSAPAFSGRINAHIHLPPNFSAFETVEQAISLAAGEQISALGASNYYDYEVYGDFGSLALANRIYPLFGLEIVAMSESLRVAGVKINDPGNPGKVYICGKAITRFDQMTPEASRLLGLIRRNDSQRMTTMCLRLEEVFQKQGVKTGLDAEGVIARVMRRHGCPRERVYLQERHICQAFQERFFELMPADARVAKMTELFGAAPKSKPDDAVSIQNEIRSHLMKTGKPAFVDESFLSLEDAFKLICELGGVPCYPVLADGQNPISAYEAPVEKLIENLRAANVWMVEFIPLRNAVQTVEQFVPALRKAGFVVTGGTEHNTLDLIPIEPACIKVQPVPAEIMAIFREGACVIAGHQQMVLNGQCGYTDGQGRLNTKFASGEERIRTFARIGAAAINRIHTR